MSYNTLLYLDWDRRSFPYPVIPFLSNCYGSNLGMRKAAGPHCSCAARWMNRPSRSAVAAAVAVHGGRQGFRGGIRGIAVAAGVDRLVELWHCFLSPTNGYLWPDHAADRLSFDALLHANYEIWRKRSLKDTERAGQHEMLNWVALMGAMETLHRRPAVQDYVETHILMSEQCFVSYPA